MDGFAGFPLRASLPRGSAFVNYTRTSRPAASPTPTEAGPSVPEPTVPKPNTKAPRESLAVLRGAERVVPDMPARLGSEGDPASGTPADALGLEGDLPAAHVRLTDDRRDDRLK